MTRPLTYLVVFLLFIAFMADAMRVAAQPASGWALEEVVALDWPVSFAFAPDGRLFINQRLAGDTRIVRGGQLLAQPFAHVDVVTAGETGLLGLALHPTFPTEPFVYAYYTLREAGQTFNRVGRWRAVGDSGRDFQIILDRIPAAGIHNGGRLAFGPDGKLYVTTGDAAERERAQDLRSLAGKVLRLNPDGSIPADNPFPGSPVYTLGHRNIFGLTFHPSTGRGFITENGPATDDEINILRAGANYGWPTVLGRANDPRFVDPILTYTPNIAPTGLAFYAGPLVPAPYHLNLFFGDWLRGQLHRIPLAPPDYTRPLSEEIVADFDNLLDVQNGPDGFLYVSTSSRILRLRPPGAAPITVTTTATATQTRVVTTPPSTLTETVRQTVTVTETGPGTTVAHTATVTETVATGTSDRIAPPALLGLTLVATAAIGLASYWLGRRSAQRARLPAARLNSDEDLKASMPPTVSDG